MALVCRRVRRAGRGHDPANRARIYLHRVGEVLNMMDVENDVAPGPLSNRRPDAGTPKWGGE